MSNRRPQGLPANAKRVFEGVIFDVYQWQQQMFDGSFETFEKLTRPDNVTILATVGQKIILLKEKQPDSPDYFFTLPTGRVDKPGEEALLAAKRELKEETGYQSNDWVLFKKLSARYKLIFNQHIFIAKECKLVGSPQLDVGENISVGFMSFDELFAGLEEERIDLGQMLLIELMKIKYNKQKLADFKKMLFSKSF